MIWNLHNWWQIVQRLQTMAAQDSDIEVRRFEKDGVEKAIVTFNQETSSFELVDVETNQTLPIWWYWFSDNWNFWNVTRLK